MKRWYAEHTRVSSVEDPAYHQRNQGFAACSPRYRRIRRHAPNAIDILRRCFRVICSAPESIPGLFDTMVEDKRVYVLLDLIGQRVRVTLRVDAVVASA
ncbi:hypothetical protein [cf. Phormidesmis sp. LEGE 11477]|uniref:hypothetical protein n=1 Tax=cf. Phormidesmis sp. LEGE 11477 TaxID=1828680 RepID=UPI00187DFE73|nr:hypothetical protein [cf. Phormidesmis sp. LEGE 11477]MBE9064841.1 hypothetical protein [cf. Phormidesmis sp. LEGE 11477]